MGQYYMMILGNEFGTDCKVFNRSVDGEYNFAKLLEHSWWENSFVNSFSERLYNKLGRVIWCGDYADEPDDFDFPNCSASYIPCYREVWGDKVQTLSSTSTDFKLDDKFLVNYDTKEYVDLNEYKSKSIDEHGWCIHPLPLLTAVGNGRGGGDFHESNIGIEYVGIWAWHLLTISDSLPKDFTKLNLGFIEKRPSDMKKVKVLTLEVDHKIRAIIPHVRFIDSDNTLEEMYRLIGCDFIDIAQVEVGGKFFDVYCDDEFLLKEKPVPTLFLSGEQVLCGNLVFTTCDKDGKLENVSEEDIDKLIDFILIQAVKLRIYLPRRKTPTMGNGINLTKSGRNFMIVRKGLL